MSLFPKLIRVEISWVGEELFVGVTGATEGKVGIAQTGHVQIPEAHALAVKIDYIQAAVVLPDAEEVLQRHS